MASGSEGDMDDVQEELDSDNEPNEQSGDEGQEETTTASSKSQKGNNKVVGKSAALKAAEAKRGKYSKSKSGMKWCRCCHKTLPLEKFGLGSADCLTDRVAVNNLQNAAKAQDKVEWLKAVFENPQKLKAVVANYHSRCPARADKKKRASFSVLDWIEETRQESQVLTDGVYEMMDGRQYAHFVGKPKNGGLDSEAAKENFTKLHNAPDTITDKLGTSDKYLQRVAVKVKDVVIIRDAKIESRGVRSSNLENKKGTIEDQAKLQSRLARGTSGEDFGIDRLQAASAMMSGRSAGEGEASAFTNSGLPPPMCRSRWNPGSVLICPSISHIHIHILYPINVRIPHPYLYLYPPSLSRSHPPSISTSPIQTNISIPSI